jgi:hypothetical protein
MKKFAYGLAFAAATLSSVGYAQVKIDMMRVTCAQYLALPPDQSAKFSAWMSGWFNQRSGYAWIDLNRYAQNVVAVKGWCTVHPDQSVMESLRQATQK